MVRAAAFMETTATDAKVRRALRLFVFLIIAAGFGCIACDDPADVGAPAVVTVTAPAAVVTYRDTLRLAVDVIGSNDDVLPSTNVTWSSSDAETATVSPAGLVTGIWPGTVTIRAHAGALVDSVNLLVSTRGGSWDVCRPVTWLPFETHGFHSLTVNDGSLWNVGHPIATYFTFHGVRLFHNAGVMYGTAAGNAVVARTSFGGWDLGGGSSCVVPETNSWHTVALLQAPGHGNPITAIPGLTVIQEAFAFPNALDDDYVLVRYTFKNQGTEPLTGFRFGVLADFDVVDAGSNVGSWNAALGTAEVVAADSVTQTAVGGFKLIGVSTESYRTTFPSGPRQRTRSEFFAYLTDGSDGTGTTAVEDVRQLLGAEPFDLAIGASKSVWFAIAGGLTRAEYEASMARASAAAEFLEAISH